MVITPYKTIQKPMSNSSYRCCVPTTSDPLGLFSILLVLSGGGPQPSSQATVQPITGWLNNPLNKY